MNKSILKHEIRSMRWMLLLSILSSLFLSIMFSVNLDGRYASMFSDGIRSNKAIVQESFRNITGMILIIFIAISIIQIFMQFKSEKSQETGRFLKSLPVNREEFFKIKLSTGLINISLAFVVLAIGITIVRNNNMFWVKDIYSISAMSEPFIKADGLGSLLKEIGLIYLVVLSFYTFLFMVQYTFSNVIGGIVTGILVWLAPIFIVNASMFTLEKFISRPIFRTVVMASEWLLPWLYPFTDNYNPILVDINGRGLGAIGIIEYLGAKYTISIVLILINIIIAYRFNKRSKVESENMIIVFNSIRNIFKFGVTICSGLLIPTVLSGIMGLQIHNIVYILLILLGGSIGYFASRKITEVGSI